MGAAMAGTVEMAAGIESPHWLQNEPNFYFEGQVPPSFQVNAIRCLSRGILALGFAGWIQAAPGQSWEAAQSHWAYQPLTSPPLPPVRGEVWTPIDAFLLDRLESRGLDFAPAVPRWTWLRRVTFDLHGLPPTWEEWREFEKDTRPGAEARVIDRLLSSPRYGERWGRHWLDVARYADTKDLVLLYGRDALRPFAYTYRDYVVRAFNEGLPFDAFIRDQIAADLTTPSLPEWRLAALGFLTLGRLFDNNRHDQIDDQIDTVTRGMLGLTVSCARCHDHKYDAVTMADYYGLYGVFASTEIPLDLPLLEDPRDVPGGLAFEKQLAEARQALQDHIDAEYTAWTRRLRARLPDYWVRAATTQPDFNETAQFFLSLTPDDFRPLPMGRTRRFLKERLRPDDPVYGPWALWENAQEQGIADDGNSTIPAVPLLSPDGAQAGEESRWNPVLARELRARRNSLRDRASWARVYGEILVEAALRLGHTVEGREPLLETISEADPAYPAWKQLADDVVGPLAPLAFDRRETPHHMSRPEKDRYGGLVLALDQVAIRAEQRPPARAMILRDLNVPVEPRIFVRGSPARLGDPVDRSVPRLITGGEPWPMGSGSGRLGLADALTDSGNPLTARVWVNRVWMHHFGEPLVHSTTDFGTRSDGATHPELLDWLANGFIESGWDTRWVHRTLLLSRAYAQAATRSPEETSVARLQDPDNALLWQWRRRRLDWEAFRDTLLDVSGQLDLMMGGPPVDLENGTGRFRRTLYGLIDRQNLAGNFRVFDFATPDVCAERRPLTTVPQQALFALNSRLVLETAAALVEAEALTVAEGLPEDPSVVEGVRRLFRRILGRDPHGGELAAAGEYLTASWKEENAKGRSDVAEEQILEGRRRWEQLAQILMVSNEAVFVD